MDQSMKRDVAELVAGDIRDFFNEPNAEIIIKDSEDWGQTPGNYVLCWEMGPDEWTILYSQSDEPKLPQWLFVEPVNHTVLGVYPR